MMYFETIRCEDSELFYLEYHQKRIAKTIGLNINLQDFIYPPNNNLLKCKVIYNDTGIVDILFIDYTPKEISVFKIVVDDNIDYKYKMTNRDVIDKLVATKDDAHEIIIVKNGLITDTSIANIAIYDGKDWISPKVPLLEGTCKARMVDEQKIILKDITVQQLIKAKKIALMNAMIEFKIINDFNIIT